MNGRTTKCVLVCTSIACAALRGVSAAAELQPIELKLEDRLGAQRSAEAVCSGVPFAKGVLRPGTPMRVETTGGKALPTQTKVLVTWPDGSVRFLLVQFLADCPAGQRTDYRLVCGDAPACKKLVVSNGVDHVLVHTGSLTAVVPKDKLTLFDEVRFGASGKLPVLSGGMPMTFVLADGTVHTAAGAKPDLVQVEEAGPVRATVRIVGWLIGPEKKKSYKLDARLRFYAGQSYVQADVTFICLGKPNLHVVKEIRIDLTPHLGESPTCTLPGGVEGALAKGQPGLLTVDDQLTCRVGFGDQLKTADKPLDGWAVVKGQAASLGVAVRDFWHLNAKAIEVSPDRITLDLWSSRGGKPLRLGRTRAKTHNILIDFGESAQARLDRVRAFQEPLIATPTAEYTCSTDALGTLSPEGATQTAEFDKKTRAAFEVLAKQRRTLPLENGMIHYGDYYHGGYKNKMTRGDLEYDTGHACFLLYARSGNRDYYNFAVACNQHLIDMDVNQENGEQRFHGYSERAETHEEVTTGLEWGHVFTDCSADAYCLTGDERSLEAVKMIADATLRIAQSEEYIRNVFAGAERQLGWPLAALCRAYEITGDRKYLDASKKIVDFVKRYAEDPLEAYKNGKWWRCWMMDGCKTFMVGQLHDGLSAYYRITRDDGLKRAITISLDWMIDHMWHAPTGGFVYEFNAMNRGHRHESLTGLNMLIVDAFRFGYEMTGDKRYLSVATRAFDARVKEMTTDVDGKQFSQDTRTSPFTAAYLYRENITSDKLPPAPKRIRQRPCPPSKLARPDVLLRASFEGDLSCETPSGERAGQVIGKVAYVEGKEGKAIHVGKEGYARLPAPPDMLRGPGTIEFWVRLHFKKRADRPGQRAVFHVEGATPLIDSLAAVTIYDEFRIRLKDHVGCLNGTAEGKIGAWEPDQWHHVVVTWDGKRVKLYLDGKEQMREKEGTQAWDGMAHWPAGEQTTIDLGWRFGNWYCDCDIDSLTVYGRALKVKDIAMPSGTVKR